MENVKKPIQCNNCPLYSLVAESMQNKPEKQNTDKSVLDKIYSELYGYGGDIVDYPYSKNKKTYMDGFRAGVRLAMKKIDRYRNR